MTFCRVGIAVDPRDLVQKVHIVRYLGLLMDSDLSWKHHSDVISSKLLEELECFVD